jgi:hypothetical protein
MIGEVQRFLVRPQPVRQRAEREIRQVQLVFAVHAVVAHRLRCAASVVFQNSLQEQQPPAEVLLLTG